MLTEKIPFYDEAGYAYKDIGWNIYAIIGEAAPGVFYVKVGVSQTVYERYSALESGIPFVSLMLWANVGEKHKAYKLEKKIHNELAEYNSRGEWFCFHVSEKEIFHEVIKEQYYKFTGKYLEWNEVTEEQRAEFIYQQMNGGKYKRVGRKKKKQRRA